MFNVSPFHKSPNKNTLNIESPEITMSGRNTPKS